MPEQPDLPAPLLSNGGLLIGTPFGIALHVHWTFVLLLAWVAWVAVSAGAGLGAAFTSLTLVCVVFGFVVLHELGHALTARQFGVQTRDITLYPIGGVARLDRMPEAPLQELTIALAGPAVNLVLAAGIAALLMVVPSAALAFALIVNLALGVFNLVPAFPMDGGRVLRAVLAMRMERVTATRIAAGVGQGLAVVLGLYGLFTNWVLVFIAVFVFLGARQEARAVVVASLLRGVRVRDVMQTRFEVLRISATLRDAADALLEGEQHDFPVVDDTGAYVGLLRRETLLRAVNAGDANAAEGPIRDICDTDVPELDAEQDLADVLARLGRRQLHSAVVTASGRPIGLLTDDNVAEWLALQPNLGAAQTDPARSATPPDPA